jgi:hypothetical protein
LGNLGLATVAFELTKSIGECGCKSALLLARSVDGSHGTDFEIATELLLAPLNRIEVRHIDLVVAGDVAVLPKIPVALRLGCAPPE